MVQESKQDQKKAKSGLLTSVKAGMLRVKAKVVRSVQKVKLGLKELLIRIRRRMPTWRRQSTVKIPITPKKPKAASVKAVKAKPKAKAKAKPKPRAKKKA